MDNSFRIQLKFWGVRGSIPTPTPENLGFGGNTTCLEVRPAAADPVIIDGGTGARKLGISLLERSQGERMNLNILMSHFHWDHIQGIPFFAPLYSPANKVTFHSSKPPRELHEKLEGQMTQPYFPVQFDLLGAHREFVQLTAEPLRLGSLTVHSFPLNHPQGATGFRFECEGAVVVHACDHEHGDARIDKIVREHAEGADVLIYDAQFTPAEYESKRGWGHSTWLEAARVARDANVKRLVLFHHDPSHNDDFLRNVEAHAVAEFENTEVAVEGRSIEL